MAVASLAWSQYPTEIEADLSDRGHNIMDWHRGVMSSRRLLVLLRHAPESGPYDKALRGGRQARSERVAEEHFNETARLRASFHAAHGGEDAAYEPFILSDPVDEIEDARLKAIDDAEQQRVTREFESEIGFV